MPRQDEEGYFPVEVLSLQAFLDRFELIKLGSSLHHQKLSKKFLVLRFLVSTLFWYNVTDTHIMQFNSIVIKALMYLCRCRKFFTL